MIAFKHFAKQQRLLENKSYFDGSLVLHAVAGVDQCRSEFETVACIVLARVLAVGDCKGCELDVAIAGIPACVVALGIAVLPKSLTLTKRSVLGL